MADPTVLGAGSSDSTVIAESLNVRHGSRRNLVWSAGMALAWRELVELARGPIVLADESREDPGGAIVRALNTSGVDATVIDTDSCVARAGLQSDALLAEIRDELACKFAEPTPRHLPDGAAPDLFLAYAYMQKLLAFEV